VSARRLLSSALAGLLAAGCAIALPPPREPVGEAARAALALLTERWHGVSDLRALAGITIERGGQRQRLRGVLLARAPHSIRFEALAPFGPPLLLMVIRDGQLTVYDALTNEATVGPATAESAARVLSLAVEPDDLVAVLAGRTAPPRDLRVAEVLAPDADGASLSLIGRFHRQRVWMDFTTGVVHQLEIVGGRYVARVVFQRDGQGALTGFDLDAGEGHVRAAVRYDTLVLNGGVEADRFVLAIPKGAKIQPLR
jgi:outer membrane lipoprotein-sorting protein